MPDAPLNTASWESRPPRRPRNTPLTNTVLFACDRAAHSAELADREGRTADAEFYWAMLDILLEWYKPAKPPGQSYPIDPASGPACLREAAQAKAGNPSKDTAKNLPLSAMDSPRAIPAGCFASSKNSTKCRAQ